MSAEGAAQRSVLRRSCRRDAAPRPPRSADDAPATARRTRQRPRRRDGAVPIACARPDRGAARIGAPSLGVIAHGSAGSAFGRASMLDLHAQSSWIDRETRAQARARVRGRRLRPGRRRASPFLRRPSSTSAIMSPISRNSAGPKPRVVPAGEPTRMPLVLTGGSGSNGMPFLLQVIAARSSASSASLPVTPSGRQVDQHQMRVGAARDDSAPRSLSVAASALAFSTTAGDIALELGPQRLAERDRLGGDDVHQRPALQAREHRRVDLLGDAPRHWSAPCRRAGRAASCAWWW